VEGLVVSMAGVVRVSHGRRRRALVGVEPGPGLWREAESVVVKARGLRLIRRMVKHDDDEPNRLSEGARSAGWKSVSLVDETRTSREPRLGVSQSPARGFITRGSGEPSDQTGTEDERTARPAGEPILARYG